ncbi:MAG: polyhydroxyalkanoate depolymerase [Betaproteobacteria bacterium]|nr:polyhydroxyalkanoate depolymerase [Betaproteobacteria bacterium]MDE2423741.1 polyhydroxyalkanoate depolymerase [Betaproteobacteria bacterium]
MLYELHELQHASFSSLRAWAKTAAQLYASPYSPLSYTPMARVMAASSEVFLRTTQRYEKPVFGIDHVELAGEVYTIKEETVLEMPFCHLKRFSKVGINTPQPKVLIVAPLSGHYATLLRDTVRSFVKDFEVWITDWVDAKLVPLSHGAFRFDDYVLYVQDFIRFIGPDVHVVSVCQPTVPVLVAVSLMSANQDPLLPKSMVMMGGPIDTRKNPTTVNNFAKSHPLSWFESRVIYRVPVKYPGYLRQVYPGFLQHAGFVAMNPGRHIESHRDFFYQLVRGDGENANVHRNFYDEYNAVMDLPAEYYLETLDRVFHRHALAEGTLTSCGELIRPEAITKTALMTVEGELDDISGNGQTMAAQDLCVNIPEQYRQSLLAKDVGHYGIFSGRRFREMIYPSIKSFIEEKA